MARVKFPRLFLALGLLLLAAGASFADIPSFVDYWATQTSVNNWVVDKDKYSYGAPLWTFEQDKLLVHNRQCLIWDKWLWLEVNYQTVPSELPGIVVQASESTVTPLGVQFNGNDVTWAWRIHPQPWSEDIIFSTTDFYNMVNINKIEVATWCGVIPEPGSLVVLASGVVWLAGLAIRRRR